MCKCKVHILCPVRMCWHASDRRKFRSCGHRLGAALQQKDVTPHVHHSPADPPRCLSPAVYMRRETGRRRVRATTGQGGRGRTRQLGPQEALRKETWRRLAPGRRCGAHRDVPNTSAKWQQQCQQKRTGGILDGCGKAPLWIVNMLVDAQHACTHEKCSMREGGHTGDQPRA